MRKAIPYGKILENATLRRYLNPDANRYSLLSQLMRYYHQRDILGKYHVNYLSKPYPGPYPDTYSKYDTTLSFKLLFLFLLSTSGLDGVVGDHYQNIVTVQFRCNQSLDHSFYHCLSIWRMGGFRSRICLLFSILCCMDPKSQHPCI